MDSLFIRGVDEQLSALLKKEAAASHKSVNQLVLEVLRTHLGLEKEKRFTREHHDLDHLFGRWSEREHNKIREKIMDERVVDEELWK